MRSEVVTRTAIGEMLTRRERTCLWSPGELVAVYDEALGDPEVWDDVLDAARRVRRQGFGDALGLSGTVLSAGPAPRLAEGLAHVEVLGDGGTARQVAVLARQRQVLAASTLLAAVPEQHDVETLRSLRRAGADVCVLTGQSLLDAQNAAVAAGFTRVGLTATLGADARSELASVLVQSNHLMEELGLFPHTIAVRRDLGAGSRDPFLLQIALLRLAHPSSNILVADGEPDLLDVGANLVSGSVPPGYRIVADVDFSPELRELSYRRLASFADAGGLISEVRAKPTETFMLVRRPAGPGSLGNNLHRGLYRSKDPETVVLIEGTLSITSRHPDLPEPMVTVIASTPEAPHKLTVPRNVYHEVFAVQDSLLIEFSSVAEDTTDSFPWPL